MDSKATEQRRANMQREQGSTKVPPKNPSKVSKKVNPLKSTGE